MAASSTGLLSVEDFVSLRDKLDDLEGIDDLQGNLDFEEFPQAWFQETYSLLSFLSTRDWRWASKRCDRREPRLPQHACERQKLKKLRGYLFECLTGGLEDRVSRLSSELDLYSCSGRELRGEELEWAQELGAYDFAELLAKMTRELRIAEAKRDTYERRLKNTQKQADQLVTKSKVASSALLSLIVDAAELGVVPPEGACSAASSAVAGSEECPARRPAHDGPRGLSRQHRLINFLTEGLRRISHISPTPIPWEGADEEDEGDEPYKEDVIEMQEGQDFEHVQNLQQGSDEHIWWALPVALLVDVLALAAFCWRTTLAHQGHRDGPGNVVIAAAVVACAAHIVAVPLLHKVPRGPGAGLFEAVFPAFCTVAWFVSLAVALQVRSGGVAAATNAVRGITALAVSQQDGQPGGASGEASRQRGWRGHLAAGVMDSGSVDGSYYGDSSSTGSVIIGASSSGSDHEDPEDDGRAWLNVILVLVGSCLMLAFIAYDSCGGARIFRAARPRAGRRQRDSEDGSESVLTSFDIVSVSSMAGGPYASGTEACWRA